MIFLCIACFKPSKSLEGSYGREGSNCRSCNSTSRDRAMLLAIHGSYLRKILKNPRYRPNIVGVSDGELMATALKRIYREKYQNFHYHLEPYLDITQVPLRLHSSADIISCSEVLEHVAPPVRLAFKGLFEILKPQGSLIFSVPHTLSATPHIEHFPDMLSYQLDLKANQKPRMIANLTNGEIAVYENLVFHGGVGSTIEFRVFSESSLKTFLNDQGFKKFNKKRNVVLLGISWEPWSRVWSVRKDS